MSTRPRSEIVEELHELGIIIDRREIFLGKESGDDDDTNYKSAMKFIKNMRLLQRFGGVDPIVVHQLNEGGDWCCGMAIYDIIANSESHVTIVCHGAAMSMGSIIPQAADLRVMMPSATFMVHEGSSPDIEGTFKQGKAWNEFYEKCAKRTLEIYAEKCQRGVNFQNKTLRAIKTELQRKMCTKEDWIINAREAVEYGFADAVLGDEGYENLNSILNKT
jgi:ATP-dependent protease ClpP protease subunit